MHLQQGLNIHEAKTDKNERQNRQNMIIVGYFNPLFSVIDRTSRHKISKDKENLKNIISQFDATHTEHCTP